MNNQPEWIVEDLTQDDINSICQGGRASGAYMPAVTYWQALETMGEHGDDVLDYIYDELGELPDVPPNASWSGLSL